MFDTPEGFLAALEADRANWAEGYCFENGILVWMHGTRVPAPLQRLRALSSERQLPFRFTVVPGAETQHPDKHARLRVFRAAYHEAQTHEKAGIRQVSENPRTTIAHWDLFISHAGEDKSSVALPLADALLAQGLTVWVDTVELTLGDSLRRRIDEGLSRSRFGVVILSRAFFTKQWPQRELDGLFSRESLGDKVILPVVHDLGIEELVSHSPMLADRVHVLWSEGLSRVVEKIVAAIARDRNRVDLSARDSISARSSAVSITVNGSWWSQFQGTSPLYVRFELLHKSSSPDAVRRAFVEYEGQQVDTEEPQKLPRLTPVDFKPLVLKFFPPRCDQPRPAKLVLETVCGERAECVFETWYGG
jgi:hypothetical protein